MVPLPPWGHRKRGPAIYLLHDTEEDPIPPDGTTARRLRLDIMLAVRPLVELS
jgi:hypothetical protein